jgi:hypothetical protein
MNTQETNPDIECFVVLSAAEWRNFLALGHVRLLKNRILSGKVRAERNMQKSLFVRAPHGNLEDSGDYRVVELSPNWLSLSEHHSCDPKGDVVVVSIDAMLATFPALEKDRLVLEDECQQLHVAIGPAEFEEAWTEWMLYDGIKLSLLAGNRMTQLLGVERPTKDEETFDAEDIAKVILGRAESTCQQPLLNQLIEIKNEIRDFVAEDIGYESFLISSVCEWVFRAINVDSISQDNPLANQLKSLHSQAKEVLWNQPNIQTLGLVEALQKIRSDYPDAFNNLVTPLFIPLFIEFSENIRANKLNLENTRARIEELAKLEGESSATLLAFFVGVEMKLERVRLLEANPQLWQRTEEDSSVAEVLESQADHAEVFSTHVPSPIIQ